tara:strand:- start:498 stop:677 length:180 start_codon:yes stop_codon:yes gene_type:complete
MNVMIVVNYKKTKYRRGIIFNALFSPMDNEYLVNANKVNFKKNIGPFYIAYISKNKYKQ